MNQITLESLPDGTIIKTKVVWNFLPFTHYGTIQRQWDGQVFVHHNSKKRGYAATTNFDQFHDGNPVFVHRVSATLGEGWEIAARARADVERGIRWTIDNNCEDMVSRAITGRNGSPTRNAFLGVSLGLGVVGVLIAIAKTS